MNQRIIYTREDGGLSILVPAADCGLTIEEIAIKDCPPGAAFEIVDVSEIPADRTFRNAWKRDAGKVATDVAKAKLIAHDMRRAARAEAFAPLDVEATIPAKASQAEAARQAIRDKDAEKQAAINACSTAEQIKAALRL